MTIDDGQVSPTEEEKRALVDILTGVWKDGFNAALDSAIFNLRAEEMHDAADKVQLLRCR